MPQQFLIDDSLQSCPYLPGKVARLPLWRQLGRIGLEEADLRFEQGERRVGRSLYRTACPTCVACRSLRIPVEQFLPSRSQRRVAARWADQGRVELGPPSCSDEKLELYNRHKTSRNLSSAGDEPLNTLSYTGWLIESCFFTMEMRYYLKDRLIGVGIVDLGATSASSVYYYFDPDPEISKLSPGVWSVLEEINFCRQTGRSWLYLGLWVADCSHLAYKADYTPHERWEDGRWQRFER